MTKPLLLPLLTKALNRYLALDPMSPQRLQALTGKIIAIELPVWQHSFQLTVEQQKIQLTMDPTLAADVTIRGTPLGLLTLALRQDKKQAFFADTVTISGDAALGQQVVDLFNQLEIDWEEYAAQAIGDLPAHELGRLTKNLFAWGKTAKNYLLQDIREYIHEEQPYFPPQEALEDFYQAVDQLRLDLDRLEARVKHLQEQAN